MIFFELFYKFSTGRISTLGELTVFRNGKSENTFQLEKTDSAVRFYGPISRPGKPLESFPF
jgi:hypothetical protein